MDDMLVRPVYPRRNSLGRKRKRYSKEKNRSGLNIRRQIVLCLILLLLAVAVKEIDSPVTNLISGKVKLGLEQNIEIDGILAVIDNFLNSLKNDKPLDHGNMDTTVFDIPVSAGIYVPETNDEVKIDYGGVAEGDESENKAGTTSEKNEKTSDEQTGTYSFAVPVSGVIGSNFGDRVHPIKGTEEFHKGVDIKANEGVPIKAALDGEVIEAAKEATYGNFVEIKHDDGFITIYAHCSVLMVKRGQNVKKGQTIAKVGSTGSSTGPHLHFEVWKNGNPVNPLSFVKIPSS